MKIFPIVVIIPSLNPDNKLIEVVNNLFAAGFSDLLIVDDGSRQDCKKIFSELTKKSGCVVLHHEQNKGKGRALKTAFSYYLENYDPEKYYGIVTADADGQHLPKDIFRSAKALMAAKERAIVNALILGTRDFNEEQVPFKNRNGNKITTLVFQLLYGKRINDTQTGLRAISNNFLRKCLSISGERFEYEINMLILAVLQEVYIEEVIIETVYFENNRETHFRPFRDSAKIYGVMFASFIRFTCSGLVSTLVDQGLFALFQKLVFISLDSTFSIPLSTLLARICSSYLNYSLNRSLVFNAQKTHKNALTRYYLLCVLQMAVSALLVTVIHIITTWNSSLIKIIVDLILFFISYRIQKSWVFREKIQ